MITLARPTTKMDLLAAANQKFSDLESLLDSMTPEQLEANFQFDATFLKKQTAAHWTRDKNVRDVLIHLYEWHELLLNWITNNQAGIPTPFLPAPYNWKNYAEMNVSFQKKHQDIPMVQAWTWLENSHQKVLALIATLSNDALFLKGYFPWAKTTTVGSYCVSATSSHYDWAIKKLKKHCKS